MTAALNKKTFILLGLGLLLMLAIGMRLEDRYTAIALVSGYVLFSFNYILLARIYSGLVQVSQTGVSTPTMKTWLAVGTLIKFVGLIGALYALIVVWELPGLYIAVGSLVSLLLLTGLLVMSYLKSFSSSQP